MHAPVVGTALRLRYPAAVRDHRQGSRLLGTQGALEGCPALSNNSNPFVGAFMLSR